MLRSMGRGASALPAMALCLLVGVATAPPPQQPSCNYSQPVPSLCRAFCNDRCSFLNTSSGERGRPQTITVYRLTPSDNTDLVNKDAGNAAGDMGFFLSGLGGGRAGFLTGTDTVIAQYEVLIDGQYGPYLMCNPLHGWKNQTDSRTGWYCSLSCNSPPHCKGRTAVNSSINGTHGPSCDCGRAMRTVGRDDRGYLYEHRQLLQSWGRSGRSVVGSAPAASWSAVSQKMAGMWYSFPAAGQCQGADRPGQGEINGDCTWRVRRRVARTINATCMAARVDGAVRKAGRSCFQRCLPANASCTTECYLSTLLGAAAARNNAMSVAEILAPWNTAFRDVTQGGCPNLALGGGALIGGEPHHS